MTKKRLALLTVAMTAVLFILLMLLPDSVTGSRSEQRVMFATKILFLSASIAAAISVILVLIFKCDFVSRYRKSILGVLWLLLNTLLTMLVMTLVFSYLFRNQIENFPVYLLSGQIIFGFFNESTTQAMGSVIGNEGIIKKIYIPN